MSYLMTNDVIFAKNVCWFRSTYIAHKQFIFSQLLKLRWHTRIYEETFHVNSSANNANYLKFYSGKVESTAIATLAIIPEISDSNLETRRYSPKSGVSGIIRKSWQHCTHDRNRFSLKYKKYFKKTSRPTHLDYYNTQGRQKWAANNKREIAVPFQFPHWKNKQT